MVSKLSSLEQEKQQLRDRCLLQRSSLSDEDVLSLGQQVAKRFIGRINIASNAVVAGYMPIGKELDVRPLMNTIFEKKHRIGLPVIQGKEQALVFHEWLPDSDLALSSYFHVYEPCTRMTERLDPNVVLVPLVAFDRTGARLGFGGGYYDRTLAHLRRLYDDFLAVGVAYAMQEVDSLPVGSYDEPLDYLVTEHEVLDFRPAG